LVTVRRQWLSERAQAHTEEDAAERRLNSSRLGIDDLGLLRIIATPCRRLTAAAYAAEVERLA
jgi:hypothetical protein